MQLSNHKQSYEYKKNSCLGDCCLQESDFSMCLLCTCYEKEEPVTFDGITSFTTTTAKDIITDPTQVEKMPKTEKIPEVSSTTAGSGISVEPTCSSGSCLYKFMPIMYLLLTIIIKNL